METPGEIKMNNLREDITMLPTSKESLGQNLKLMKERSKKKNKGQKHVRSIDCSEVNKRAKNQMSEIIVLICEKRSANENEAV